MRQMKKHTIKEVASRLNVSISTVSRAFNNAYDIKEETRARILKTAKIMGYYPNPIARKLVQNRTFNIGVVVPEFINEYYAFVPLLVFTGLIFSLLSFILRIIRIWRKEIFSKFLLPLRFKLVFGAAVLLTIIHTVTGPIHLFKNTQDYLFGYPTSFEISAIVGYLLGLLNLWLAIECFQLWKKKQGSLLVRVYVSIVTFALFMHIVYLFYWKFL